MITEIKMITTQSSYLYLCLTTHRPRHNHDNPRPPQPQTQPPTTPTTTTIHNHTSVTTYIFSRYVCRSGDGNSRRVLWQSYWNRWMATTSLITHMCRFSTTSTRLRYNTRLWLITARHYTVDENTARKCRNYTKEHNKIARCVDA